MNLGENGNRANSGQKLTKINGNQRIIRVVSPNSDMVCGIPHKTEIDPNESKVSTILSHVCVSRCIISANTLLLNVLSKLIHCY